MASSAKLALLRENLRTDTEPIILDSEKKEAKNEKDTAVEFAKSEAKQTKKEKEKKPEKKKPGRKPKAKEVRLSKRVVMLISESDAKIIEEKRRAGKVEEMDESQFIREWCRRTGLFDKKKKIESNPWGNLPN